MISRSISILKSIVEGIGQNLSIFNYKVIDLSTLRILTSQTLYAKVGDYLTINNTAYRISGVSCGKYIDIDYTAETLPESNTFNLKKFTFFHGTINAVTHEINQTDVADKDFICYYVEQTSSNLNLAPSAYIREVNNARLLFLIQCNYEDWLTEDHYSNVIELTDIAVDEFISKLNIAPNIGELTNATVLTHAIAGVKTDKGTTNHLLNTWYSGTEIRIAIPFINQNCNCN